MLERETEIIFNNRVAENRYLLGLHAPDMVASAGPGQFIMLRIEDGMDPFLRRPFSICGHRDRETLLILYRMVGRGTALLAKKTRGAFLSVLGPLGRGFEQTGDQDFSVLIGGGMGLAPLLFLARSLTTTAFHLLAGFGTSNEMAPLEQIISPLPDMSTATDDGSLGFEGPVTELFLKRLASFKAQQRNLRAYACGPMKMLKKISGICLEEGIDCRVSLETHMACGIGACLGCAVKASPEADQPYYHVCRDGPVFAAEDIDWASIA